ncbi:MAG: DNA-J related domain-containing protein [Enterobacterales bacterium]|nr:DNA-J related domain-containing protein [Enterobacterales bacterium]
MTQAKQPSSSQPVMDKFDEIIFEFISSKKDIKEFELLTFINNNHADFFNSLEAGASLYKKHFYLFNFLYRLNQKIACKKLGLAISAMSIRLVPINELSTELVDTNLLTSFYLDQNNLHLPEQQVKDMMDHFWTKYLALGEKSEALKILGLEKVNNLKLSILKKRYNELANKHHPDKGGEVARFVKIKTAYEQLKRILK